MAHKVYFVFRQAQALLHGPSPSTSLAAAKYGGTPGGLRVVFYHVAMP